MNTNRNIPVFGVDQVRTKFRLNTKTVQMSLIALMVLCSSTLFGQLSVPGTPPTIKHNIGFDDVPVETMVSLDMTAILQEDVQDEAAGMPPRFGYPLDVALDLDNAGVWTEMPDGTRVWRLRISSPGAKSINLLYDNYNLPAGARLYIYNTKKTHLIGAFTDRNNKQSGGFATGLVYGDEIVLEYVEPLAVKGQGIISLAKVVHGYRFIPNFPIETEESFGDSGSCQVNVNCSEGSSWQNQKNSVAMILVSGTRWCSGSIVNTTSGNCAPYFLTADHCLTGSLDAISSPNATNWSFYWNYESAGCADGSDFLPPSTNGGTLVANDSPSDFALFLLTEDPADDPSIDLYYSGWDRSTSPGTNGVGIHHPSGDIKKISTHTQVPVFDDWFGTSPSTSHWEVFWDATTNGHAVTEGGSSGSPLYNAAKRVIGQLHGGSSLNCSNPALDVGIYGALSYSWDNAGATDNRRRLRTWLDDASTGATVLNGSTGCGGGCPASLALSGSITGGISVSQASNTITSTASLSGTSSVTYLAGNSITLLTGFSSTSSGGGTFSASIASCITSDPVVETFREEDDALIIENGVSVYPNPFSGYTNVSFELAQDAAVDVAVLDITGKIVAQLIELEDLSAGTHAMRWDSSNSPQGTYILRVVIGGEMTTTVLSVMR